VRGVGSGTLRRVHGRRVAVSAVFADVLGVEPGAVGQSFGRRSTEMSRRSLIGLKWHVDCGFCWWSRLVSNQRPSACEADALPLSYETWETIDR